MSTTASAPRPELSVIFASFNSRTDLATCIDSLARTVQAAFEVIVVDNGSTDGSPAFVRQRYPWVRVIANDRNVGHTRAINQGIATAVGRALLVMDADTVVKPSAISAMLEFDLGPADIVAPRMLNNDGTVQETARRFPKVINGLFGRRSLLTRMWPGNRFSRAYLMRDRDETGPYEVDWVSAACMLFPRDLVQRIGTWDEAFLGYWVDADWCARARRAGGRVFCLPYAEVIHTEQNRVGTRKSPSRIVMFHRGAYLFYRKHFTRGVLDPRAVAAAAVLTARTGFILAGNAMLGVKPDTPSDGRAALPALNAVDRPPKV